MLRSALSTPKDPQIVGPPSDTVQALEFSPNALELLAGAWDSTLRLWDIDDKGQSQEKAQQGLQAPVLDVSYRSDGMAAFAACCDKTAQLWDFGSNSVSTVGVHDEPIRTCHWIAQHNLLMTGGWDAKLRFWDLRSSNPAFELALPERVYAADVLDEMAVVATAQQGAFVYDLSGEPRLVHEQETKLKMQTRAVKCFPNKDGFAVTSIEGRCSIQYIDDKASQSFSFKCHRDKQNIYTVNTVNFHKATGTMATGGSDGVVTFWNKEQRTNNNSLPTAPAAITCSAFSNDDNNMIFAYGVGYDWSQGCEGRSAKTPDTIYLHAMQQRDVEKQQQRN